MWKYVLPPVLFIASLWISMSVTTSIYIEWLEQSYQRIFNENFVAIQLVRDLERSAHRLEYAWPRDNLAIGSVQELCESTIEEMDESVQRLKAISHTSAESTKLSDLSDLLVSLRLLANTVFYPVEQKTNSVMNSEEFLAWTASVNEAVGKLNSLAGDLKEINQQIIDQSTNRRNVVRNTIQTVRFSFLLTGPMIGVWLGWRLSKRLHNSVGRIAVTLQQSGGSEIDIGVVTVSSGGILGDMQQQAHKIVDRLKKAHCDLEQARGAVVRSERLAAVGLLAAGVAHEIRNPLTSVKLLLQHAAIGPEKNDLTVDKLKLILKEVNRIENTVEGLLDFSRQRSLNISSQDLRQILSRVYNLMIGRARQGGIEIVLENMDEPLVLAVDAEQIHQVFVNLFINAIEAMPNGGTLTVSPTVIDGGQRIKIEVRDNGPGIHTDLLPRLFEPFATTKDLGTGLGLAVSRRIIDEHGGTLTASNEPLSGAIFTIELPCAIFDSEIPVSHQHVSSLLTRAN